METSDVPLVVVLQPSLEALFRDVVGDLKAMNASIAEQERKKIDQLVAAMAPPEEVIDPANLPSAPGTSNEKKKPAPKKQQDKKESVVGESIEDLQGQLTARRRRENEEKAKMEVLCQRDTYVRAAAEFAREAEDFIASCEPAAKYTKERLQFFCSKPAESYLIEDVLGEWAEDNFPSALPSLAIDPFAIARDHNKRLEREYGYKPPRLLHDVGKVSPRTATKQDLNVLIASHDAGGTDPQEFVCAATVNAQRLAAENMEATAADAAAEEGVAASSKKSVRNSSTAVKSSAVRAAEGNSSLSLQETSKPVRPALTCSVASITLSAHPGIPTTQSFTLWNSDSHRLRIRIAQSPHLWITITPASGTVYNPDVPVNPGEKLVFDVNFAPVDFGEPTISGVIKVGYAREMNHSKVCDEMPLSQWQFLELKTDAATVLPKLVLEQEAVRSTQFPPTFAFSTAFFEFKVRNKGATGEFYVRVTNSSSSSTAAGYDAESTAVAFSCEPSKIVLDANESLSMNVMFNPTNGQFSEARVAFFSLLDAENPVEEMIVQGKGVVPRILMESVDNQLRCVDEKQDSADGTALLVLDDAALDNTSTRSLVVRNLCELPVAFEWVQRRSNDRQVQSVIIPSVGVFPAHGAIEFHVEVTPLAKAAVESLFSLFIKEIPNLPDGLAARPESDLPTEVAFLSRRKVLPILPPSLADAANQDASCDSYGLFSQVNDDDRKQLQTESEANSADVFCCALRLVADIEDMRIDAKPNFLQSDLPSLILSTTRREFTLVNYSSRAANFWIDPPEGEFHPATTNATDPAIVNKYLSTMKKIKEKYGASWKPPGQRIRENENITFLPQKGTIPGKSKVTVQVNYVLKTVGSHSVDVECYIHELGVTKSPHLRLEVEACGPSVTVEPRLLDYGVIALGEEGEGRITVTNHNCVPLDFACVDSQFHDPPRFVFLPPGGHLLPGQSLDITAYRQGLKPESAADVFEVVVVNGNVETVEVRASIQQAACTVLPSIVEFGDVDNGMPSQQQFFLTNLTAVDIPYTIVVLSQDQGLKLKVPDSGTLFAGQQGIPLSVRAIFNGSNPLSAVLALVSPKLPKPIPFEVRCTSIQQLSVALSISGPNGSLPAIRLTQSIETYVNDLLETILCRVMKDAGKVSSFCTPLVLPYAEISDEEPFCAVSAKIAVDNTSGCTSGFRMFTSVLTPMMSEYRVSPPAPDYQIRSNSLTTRSTSLAGGRNSLARGSLAAGSRGSLLRRSSSVNSTGSSQTSQKIVPLQPDVPAFQSKAISGVEQVEQAQKGLLKAAQSLLQDGRGCAVQLANANNALKPYGSQEVHATFVSNLPGEYTDRIQVIVDGCPNAEIPIAFTVRGKPILVDPTTSGLGPDAASGRMRLLLPEVVAGMTSIKRKLRITSRCPRDLDVDVALIDQGSFFRVTRADDGNALVIRPAGAATAGKIASPASFVLGALDSAEVLIEYTAPPGASGDWRANLSISSRIARTPFNDIFNIDEFYSINRHLYPATRQISPLGLPAAKNEVRGVPKIDVLKPLIDRPGIVFDSKLVELNLYQTRLIAQLKRKQAQSLEAQASGSAASMNPDDDSDDEGIDKVGSQVPLQEGEVSPRSNRQLLLDDKERDELKAFLQKRYLEQAQSSSNYFTNTVIEIVAQNAQATLVCDPAEMLRFPMCKVGGKCDRTIRLRNPTRTALDFRVSVDPPFRIIDNKFIPGDDVEETILEDDADIALRTMQQKNNNNTTKKKQQSAGGQASSSMAGTATNAATLAAQSGIGSTKRRDPNSDPANILYHLKPRDSVDVTVELTLSPNDSTMRHQVDGEFKISYQGGRQPQTLPMLATVHVPTVVCEPDSTWFRPTVFLHDGKPQPKHDRIVKLVNYSTCDAPFEITHNPAARTVSRGNDTITRLQRVNQALQPTPAELHAMVVDDPQRFTVEPRQGVVPAASAGGVPGTVSIIIGFEGVSNTHFECKYRVTVAGGVGHEFSVRGDSRETEV